ncbi:glycosyltransferase family 39 protein [Nanoarchaeota archaeon]
MIKKKHLTQYFRYMIFGGIGVILNLLITFTLTEFVLGRPNYWYAFLIGTIFNVIFNFIFYSRFVFAFKNISKEKKYLFFLFSGLILSLQLIITREIVPWFNLDYYLLTIMLVIFSLGIGSFFFSRTFVFSEKEITFNHCLYLLLTVFSIIIIYLIIENKIMFWDTGVYIGMAKYYFSNGSLGIMEVFRPPVLPFVLGLFWWLGLSPNIIGHVLVLLSAIGSLYFLYQIGNYYVDKEHSLILVLLLAVTSSFIFFSVQILNDILGVFLVIYASYLLIYKKNNYWLGIVCGLTGLTRFTLLLVPVAIGFSLLFLKKGWKNRLTKSLIFILGLATVIIPFLIYNYVTFGNCLLPFLEGSAIITSIGNSISEGFLFYPLGLILESVFVLVGVVGIFYCKKKKQDLPIMILLVLFLVYHFVLARKEIRYMLPLFWIFYLFAVRFFHRFRLKNKIKKGFLCLLLMVMLLQGLYGLTANYQHNYFDISQDIKENFYRAEVSGPIITTSPNIMQYLDEKTVLIVWTSDHIYEAHKKHSPQSYLINTCDLWCPANDQECFSYKDKLINEVNVDYELKYQAKHNQCDYYVFEMD